VKRSVSDRPPVGFLDGPRQQLLTRLAGMDVAGELVLRARIEKSGRTRVPACGRRRLLERRERVGDDRAVGVRVAW